MAARCQRCTWSTPTGMPDYLDTFALVDHIDHCPANAPDDSTSRPTASVGADVEGVAANHFRQRGVQR